MLDIDNAKKQATTLEDYLRTVGKKLKHTHALEAVARMNGHKSWNAFQTDALEAQGVVVQVTQGTQQQSHSDAPAQTKTVLT